MVTDYTIPHDERLWRYLKGERNNLTDRASTDLKKNSSNLKDTLKKYDYLFILFLSPIGIIFIICLWQMCMYVLELAPSTWEFWKWIADKTVYIGGIVFIVFKAQSLFNKKALGRENREQRT